MLFSENYNYPFVGVTLNYSDHSDVSKVPIHVHGPKISTPLEK